MVYLHDMNIVHRDIKPENILFDSYGNIKIVDFGYSCYYSNSEKTLNEDLGTPSYACPEMHKGIWYHPEQADVWSCGILLYVMTCGYLPFSEEDEEENGRLIENGEYQIPDTLSPQLQDLIRHMLDPNPTTRYYFKDIITHDWFNSNQALPDLIGGVNYFKMKYPIDMRILNICETYGFDKDQVRAGLENNKYNNCTAVYRLCVKKVVDAGMTSISDLQSEEFKEYKYNKENWIDERESKKTKEDFERKEMELKDIKAVYFVGAGGIGMSAIARYFIHKGMVVAGYDKTPSDLTRQLEKEGMLIHYEENVDEIPHACRNVNSCLVIYTPAIPKDHKELV